jgi:hypothetical protein
MQQAAQAPGPQVGAVVFLVARLCLTPRAHGLSDIHVCWGADGAMCVSGSAEQGEGAASTASATVSE